MCQHIKTFGDWLCKKCHGDENIDEQLLFVGQATIMPHPHVQRI